MPLWLSMPITIEAASAPVTKKIATRKTASATVIVASGNSRSVSNSDASSAMPPVSVRGGSQPSLSCRSIAVPPRIANQTNDTRLGTTITQTTNCRIVRPFEMRAMNMPTNGVQEIHQAQ